MGISEVVSGKEGRGEGSWSLSDDVELVVDRVIALAGDF